MFSSLAGTHDRQNNEHISKRFRQIYHFHVVLVYVCPANPADTVSNYFC